MFINIKKLEYFEGELPKYETSGSVGFDLRAQLVNEEGMYFESIFIKPNERKLIPTRLAIAIPEGYEMQIRPRSGLAFKKGLTVVNTPGTIDSDYRGEIMVAIINLSQEIIELKNNDRIAQGVISPIVKAQFKEVDNLEETVRGSGGFGSTGN